LIAARHIATNTDRLGAARAQSVCKRLRPFESEINHTHAGAAVGECTGDGRADTLRRTRNNRGPARQLHILRSLFGRFGSQRRSKPRLQACDWS